MTIVTQYLGFDISALAHKSSWGKWEVDHMTISNAGLDVYEYLNDDAIDEILGHIRDEASYQSYKWS